MRVEADRSADAADVLLETLLFGGERVRLRGITRGELAANSHFLLIGEPREMHGQTGEVTLRVGSHVQDGVRRNRGGFQTPLAPIEARESEAQDEKENDKDNGAFHKYCRMVSRYRV